MYVSFFNGVHCHEKEHDDDRDTRGLSYEQKVIINDAFSKKIQSARDIKHFFRAERTACRGTDREENFPLDPPHGKLKNYIQAYKRSNAVTYNPSLGDLIEWCQKNGPNIVDKNHEITLNTPFVMNFLKVSSYYYVLMNLKYAAATFNTRCLGANFTSVTDFSLSESRTFLCHQSLCSVLRCVTDSCSSQIRFVLRARCN